MTMLNKIVLAFAPTMTKIALALALAAVTATLPAAAQQAACSAGVYAAVC
jgi:hypothetical protein